LGSHSSDGEDNEEEDEEDDDRDGASPTLSEFSDAEDPPEMRQRLSPQRVDTTSGGGDTDRERTSSAECNRIDHDDEESPLRWKKGEAIGEGTFGKVFKGMNEKTGELLAIKQLALTDGSSSEVESLQREINVMWNLEHENIVRYVLKKIYLSLQFSNLRVTLFNRYMGTSKTERYLYIVLEYVTGGSIAGMISQFGAFTEKLIK
jgi:serine/threonine protein kinase